jgi:GTP-binding protein Era
MEPDRPADADAPPADPDAIPAPTGPPASAEPFYEAIPEGHVSGYVALLGKPNVGKSTLMNALLGQKLSIVTRKPQTTRQRVIGIHSDANHQVIFLDTPGIIEPRYRLHEAMMGQVEGAIRDADLLLFLADATQDTPDTFSLRRIEDRPALLVLTKMDLIAREQALPLVESYMQVRGFEEVIPTSAVKGFNLDRLMEQILARLPEGPPFYPKDMLSEHPERFFVAELIREKVFELYHEEIPYSVQVNVVTYEEREGENDLIDAEVVVNRQAHKGILIGKGGRAIKRLGVAARKEIEQFLQTGVFLQLHVKAREGWRDRESFLRSYGYR